MASPITTAGFQVSERLNPQFLDPRLLTPQYGNIIPAVSQGLGAAGQFAQIYENAQQAPVRRRLAQIQLEEAAGRVAGIPLQQQMNQLQLARLQQPIERVVGSGIEEVPRYDLQPMVDELEQPLLDASGAPRMERPAGLDVFGTETVEVYDPVSKTVKTVTRRAKPLQTLEQAASSQSIMDAREAAALAAEERNRLTAERDIAAANVARIRADAAMLRAQDLADNPDMEESATTLDENGNVVLNFVNKKTMQRVAIPTGQKRSATSTFNIFGSRGPGASIPASGAPQKSAADIAARFSNRAAPPSVKPSVPVPAFATTLEAEAAARAGLLKDGTKITVGGKPATWRD